MMLADSCCGSPNLSILGAMQSGTLVACNTWEIHNICSRWRHRGGGNQGVAYSCLFRLWRSSHIRWKENFGSSKETSSVSIAEGDGDRQQIKPNRGHPLKRRFTFWARRSARKIDQANPNQTIK